MKKSSNLLIIGLIVLAGAITFFSIKLSGNYLGGKKEKTGVECQQVGQEHFVEAKDNKMHPEVINAKLCDKLTITNKDDKLRRIAFGVHEEHIAYNGVIEKILRKDQSFTITLNEPGEFIFHDHLQEETSSNFNVAE